jgi:haloalkane dehalogenase
MKIHARRAIGAGLIILSSIAASASLYAEQYSQITYEEHSLRQTRFFLTIDGGESDGESTFLAYVDAGPRDGQPILLVHGVPTSSWSYRHLIDILISRGYRVIAPDNMGFGNSVKLKDGMDFTMQSQALFLLELMDGIGIESWIQVLHDVGGPISWEMLILDPDRISAFIILNTFAYDIGWHPPKAMDNPLVQFAMGLVGFRNRTIIRNTVCDMIAVPEELDNARALEGYYVPLETGADRAYLSFMRSFSAVRMRFPYYRAAFRRTKTPAVIVWGELDETLVGAEAIPLFMRDLDMRTVDIHQIRDAKHLVMEEAPRFIAERIDDFANTLDQ